MTTIDAVYIQYLVPQLCTHASIYTHAHPNKIIYTHTHPNKINILILLGVTIVTPIRDELPLHHSVYTCACSTMQVHWQGHSGRESAASTSRPQDTGPCSGAGLLCAVGPSPPWEGREDLCYTNLLLPPPLKCQPFMYFCYSIFVFLLLVL